mgnify:CR=1 FL=1
MVEHREERELISVERDELVPAELDAGELDLFDDLLDDCIW